MVIFSKKNTIKQIGEIIVGFGILFLGIEMMTTGCSSLSSSPIFKNMFVKLGGNPILGVLTGAVVTAILQSSSASVGILQSLATSGIVTCNSAVYIIMGQNIGTCVTAILSSVGASKNAKGAAYIHLMFNVVGSVIFSVVAFIFFTFINREFGFKSISLTEISIVHTAFNVGNTIILYPFGKFFVKAAEKLSASSKNTEEDEAEPIHLDDRILETPSFAIQNCIKEIIRMGYMSYENMKCATEAILNKDEKKITKVLKREKNIDALQSAITDYMVKICSSDINENQNHTITTLFHTVNDIERIGDHSENIAEQAQFMIKEDIEFSKAAFRELEEICFSTVICLSNALKSFENRDIDAAEKTIKGEASIDEMEKLLRAKHIKRLTSMECESTAGVVFLDVITNLERVSDHALNIAQGVIRRKV